MAGVFSSFDGVPCWNVARLLENGKVDVAFSDNARQVMIQEESDRGTAIRVLPDGQILVAHTPGPRTPSGQGPRLGLVRLRPDGTADQDWRVRNFPPFSRPLRQYLPCWEAIRRMLPDLTPAPGWMDPGGVCLTGSFALGTGSTSDRLRVSAGGAADVAFTVNTLRVAYALRLLRALPDGRFIGVGLPSKSVSGFCQTGPWTRLSSSIFPTPLRTSGTWIWTQRGRFTWRVRSRGGAWWIRPRITSCACIRTGLWIAPSLEVAGS